MNTKLSLSNYFVCTFIGLFVIIPGIAKADFDFQSVIDKAQKLASQPYNAPKPIPEFMRDLSYSEYQNIRFNPSKSLWKNTKSNFQVMLISPGFFYNHAVELNVVDMQGTHPIPFQRNNFDYTNKEIEKRIPHDLGYAGFKLTFPFWSKDQQNQFIVFAGASYFRAVGKENTFGISARGIAQDTGLPTGENFPSFIKFWLIRPVQNAKEIVVYGLLNGKSLSGAYKFIITPGKTTTIKITAVLFPRDTIQMIGIAPLTSMFYYGENTTRPAGEWRSQVHDSDGLLIQNAATREWLWHPLLNPIQLQIDQFSTEALKGFGLLQRDTDFNDYHDLNANYHQRPSAWVEPLNNWGKGKVVLVQLPTPDETNDNIVAFWTPDKPVTQQKKLLFEYTLSFGNAHIPNESIGHVLNTFIGNGNLVGGGALKGSYRMIIDFTGGQLDSLSPNASVKGIVTALDNSKIIEQFVEYNKPLHCWRLSILAKHAPQKPLHVRAFLQENTKTLTETWDYRLPIENDLHVEEH